MERGITPDWFTQDDAQRMARFVFDWNAKYGQPPSPQAVKSNAPQFRLVQVDDPIESMCDQMVTYRRRGLTMQAAADIVDLIEHSDHESAVDVMRKSLADLDRSSGVVTSDMELTKDAPQRFSWYEQIKNRPGGLLGLPTGFPTIDKATAGVQPGPFCSSAPGVNTRVAGKGWSCGVGAVWLPLSNTVTGTATEMSPSRPSSTRFQSEPSPATALSAKICGRLVANTQPSSSSALIAAKSACGRHPCTSAPGRVCPAASASR